MSQIRALIILTVFLFTSQLGAADAMDNKNSETIIREFIGAWSNLDAKELANYFAEDGTYHNIPSSAVSGRDNIEKFISGFIAPWESTEWEIVSLMADGDVVMVERVDKTTVAGKPVHLPCFGYFKLENGKIKMWRDYFDLSTYTTALKEALASAG